MVANKCWKKKKGITKASTSVLFLLLKIQRCMLLWNASKLKFEYTNLLDMSENYFSNSFGNEKFHSH